VERLGIPPYQWWSEGLHGIAGPYTNFSGEGEYSYSTSFPQPILMGAAFDDALITKVATVISTEARAFNNANRYVALCDITWAALISIQYWLGLLDAKHQPIQRPAVGTWTRDSW
jgi:beta-glucosidase-like glycosyl hydrolase